MSLSFAPLPHARDFFPLIVVAILRSYTSRISCPVYCFSRALSLILFPFSLKNCSCNGILYADISITFYTCSYYAVQREQNGPERLREWEKNSTIISCFSVYAIVCALLVALHYNFFFSFSLSLCRSSRCVNVNEWVWARSRSYVYFSLPCVCVCIAMHKCKASMPIVVRRQLQYTWDKIISIFINQSEKKCRKNAANEQRKNVRIAHTHSNTRTQWTNESQREKAMLRIKKVLKLYACINEEWQIDGEASEMKHF